VAELESRYSQKDFSLPDVIIEVQTKRKVTQAFSPFNLSAIRTVATEVSINGDSISTTVDDKQWHLGTIFGTVNWNHEESLKTKVSVSKALLAQEISQDVRISGGKVAPVHRGSTATFGDVVSEAQVAQATSAVERIKMSAAKVVKGHEASDMVYDALMSIGPDAFRKEMSDYHSLDPEFILARSVYDKISYKAYRKNGGHEEEVEVTGKMRVEGGGIRPLLKPLGEQDIYELIRQHDSHVGSTKAGMGQMLTDFFYGAPLDGLYLRCLRALTIVNQLKDTTSPIILESSDSNIALFVFVNVDRAVGVRTEFGSSRSVMEENIRQKHMFEAGKDAVLSDDIIHVYLKPVSAPLDSGMAETLNNANDILAVRLADVPKLSVFPTHVWGIKDFLLSDNKKIYAFKKDNKEFKIEVGPCLMLNKHKFLVTTRPGMLANPITGLQANYILKMFVVNSVTYRYHKLSLAALLADKRYNRTELQLDVYPLNSVKFKLLAAKKKGSLTAVLLEEGIVGGGLRRAIDEEIAGEMKVAIANIEPVGAAPVVKIKAPDADTRGGGIRVKLED